MLHSHERVSHLLLEPMGECSKCDSPEDRRVVTTYVAYCQMNAQTNPQMMIQRHLAGELFGYLSALNNFKVDMIIIEVPFVQAFL